MKKWIFHLSLFFSVAIMAQDEVPAPINVKIPLVSLRLNAGVPNPASNQVFRTKFVGVYETNLAVNFRDCSVWLCGRWF
jgi:hypothetical protein